MLRLAITGEEGTLDLSVDGHQATIHRLDGGAEDLSPPAGAWTYDTVGPIHALIAAARGDASGNHAPGEIGAATVGVLAALQRASASGGTAVVHRQDG
jgi:hypothetical protein